MPHFLKRVAVRFLPLALAVPLVSGCAAFLDNMQGPIEPQSVSGPCEVDRFFLLTLRSAPTRMTVSNTGEACSFILLNPARNFILNAGLLTGAPEHGQASASTITGRTQGFVSYVPRPGYVGPDRFEVTFQPNAIGVTVDVTVTAP